jgi:hypothetical protein
MAKGQSGSRPTSAAGRNFCSWSTPTSFAGIAPPAPGPSAPPPRSPEGVDVRSPDCHSS